MDPEFVRHGTMIAAAESVMSGVTCMNDMYFFPEIVGEVAEQLNMRTSVGMIVLDFPTQWASSADEYLDKGIALHNQFRDSNMVSTMLAPHAPYTVSDNTFEKIRKLSDELQLNVHIHVHETAKEVEDSVTEHKARPLQRLRNLGLVNSQLAAVHAVHLSQSEIEMLASEKSNIVHCPKSNLKLASGICPASALVNHSVNVAIGTDGAASNNSLNMLEELRFAALLAKGESNDASNLPVYQAIRMATINGAKSLGIEQHTGSLETGKLADITAIDLSHIYTQPVYDPVTQIVHSASRQQISDVWIGGAQVMKNRELQFIDINECQQLATYWHKRISKDLT